MPETATAEGPPAATGATVSASALAQHLDCTRTYISKLEAEGVIQRQGDGFPLDQSRVAYLRYLRRERRQSPRHDAEVEHMAAKAALLRLRIAEKQRELVPIEDFNAMIDGLCGLVLTSLSGLSARCSRDPVVRRNIDLAVHQIRREMSQAATAMADECGRAV